MSWETKVQIEAQALEIQYILDTARQSQAQVFCSELLRLCSYFSRCSRPLPGKALSGLRSLFCFGHPLPWTRSHIDAFTEPRSNSYVNHEFVEFGFG
jgi:hypothetical protein